MGTYYSYTCGGCGKQVSGATKVRKCYYCGINLCRKCDKQGFCETHSKQLYTKEKIELRSAIKMQDRIGTIFCYISLFILIIFALNFSDGHIYDGIIGVGIFLISIYICYSIPSRYQDKANRITFQINNRLGVSKPELGVGIKALKTLMDQPGMQMKIKFDKTPVNKNNFDRSNNNKSGGLNFYDNNNNQNKYQNQNINFASKPLSNDNDSSFFLNSFQNKKYDSKPNQNTNSFNFNNIANSNSITNEKVFCVNCGAEIRPENKFCTVCGTKKVL